MLLHSLGNQTLEPPSRACHHVRDLLKLQGIWQVFTELITVQIVLTRTVSTVSWKKWVLQGITVCLVSTILGTMWCCEQGSGQDEIRNSSQSASSSSSTRAFGVKQFPRKQLTLKIKTCTNIHLQHAFAVRYPEAGVAVLLVQWIKVAAFYQFASSNRLFS